VGHAYHPPPRQGGTPVVGATPLLVLLGSTAFSRTREQVTPRLVLGVTVLVVGDALVFQG